jgi:hypothetical protein
MERLAPTGMVSRRPIGTFRRGDADAQVALAAEELGGLVGVVAQCAQDRAGGREQSVLAGGRGELGQARAEDEPALHVAATSRWCSSATASRCAVGRASPVAATSCARVEGPASSALSTVAALSRTPTPLELSIT